MGRLIVFDGNSILNRAFFGVRPLNTKDGFPTNALFGFVNILKKNLAGGFTHGAVAFDLREPTFRHKACSTYKATRKGMPEDLALQLPVAKEICVAMGLTVVECPGYEADDILGTLSRISSNNNSECVLVTGDRDSFQLVTESTTVWLAANNDTKIITPDAIREMYGLLPAQLIDVKSIMGDSSDNIKGVAGIGEKGAVGLIREYGSLDGVYEHIEEIKGANKQKLINGKDEAYNSRFLAEIVKNAPIDDDFSHYEIKPYNNNSLFEIFTKLEFVNFINSMSLEKPVAKAEKYEAKKIAPACLASLEASKLYCEISNSLIETFDGKNLYICNLDKESARLFTSEKEIVFWSSKDNIRLLAESGYEFNCKYGDISLMAYIVSPSENGLTFEKAALNYLEITETENCVTVLPLLEAKLYPLLEETESLKLYNEIELPLAKVLAETEVYGFELDCEGLRTYGEKLKCEMDEAEEAIYSAVGHKFNINSPKQLANVLFEELKLPHYQKTQTGYSTSAEVLEKLAEYHYVPDLILVYRKKSKLKSTYCDGLLNTVGTDGRVHTTFRQTLTKTGRLSSIEPNLQNIPVKTEEGRELRKFFVAKPGCVLIDADYSQIELRVMAHISGDTAMQTAFINGSDIHTSTAAKVFGVNEAEVTPDMRKQAKAVNFGIIYGISDYSLGNDIGLTKKQASEYINNYLNTYPQIKAYLEKVKAEAKESGYVTTMYGRRRYIPELRSSKKSLVAFGERVAMNTPIQGTAADIIKIAMIKTASSLKKAGLDARMILQVHDELIIECSEKDAEEAKRILTESMENAASLSIPMTADAGVGSTWFEAKE